MTLRVLSIFGTRPEAVKMAPVVQALENTPGITSFVCVTAQHRQMLDQVLGLFNIVPQVDLNLMQPDQNLANLTAEIFTHLDPVLADLKPDWILVQGDTTTVMASSLAAYYRHIRVGHVEAGLRTNDKWQPFPEEINRRLASVVTDLHFAPTEWARQNLLRENIPSENIIVTGNPVIDALHSVVKMPPTSALLDLFKQLGLPYQSLSINPESAPGAPRLILVTAHRRENFGKPLENICQALKQLAQTYGDGIRIVYPVHLNPNVYTPVHRLLGGIPNIILLPPLDYLPMVHVMKQAALVLTDSGGLQEEAPALGIPVLVMRAVTERPEGIAAGTVRLVGTDPDQIVSQACKLLDDPQAYAAMAQAINPYGDGKAAMRIANAILTSTI
ncbi:MAG: UDP-N-acetylglucosamine 2-epimerase [Chloroflexi bacterium RBG_19FT_COMBO_50_10]|nr:MAG: UDP-N-acetylglucosamine 2-epimerase [Chloroflexi bacterium RBG_19FT_COMBO_50_10]